MTIETGFVLMITSAEIGSGSPELGHLLMLKFLRALEVAPTAPEVILLMNDGIRLALDDAPTLEPLRGLMQRGVRIQVCGTCLNFFRVGDRLAVGSVGTMDQAVESLTMARRHLALT